MEWLSENAGTILVGLIVFGAIALAIVRVVQSKKKGGCIGCPEASSGQCPHSGCSQCGGHHPG